MANWRRQHGEKHQMGHWRSSSSFNSYNRKPPLDNSNSAVPSWEKRFCATIGSVPWGKLLECKRYMNLHTNVLIWDDSAVKEAFDSAKKRFWDEMNGLPPDISLLDPNMYIDDVDWNSTVDPELYLDLEKEKFEEDPRNGVGGLSQLQLQDLPICPTGWEIEDEKPSDPLSAAVAQGWSNGLHENVEVSSWEQHYSQFEPAIEHEWRHNQNDYRGWIQRECYDGDSYNNMGKGRAGRNTNGNWNWNGGAWDGYNNRRENMPRSNKNAYYHGNQMYRGRGNRGGRRGRVSFAYDKAYEDKVPATTTAWKVKT